MADWEAHISREALLQGGVPQGRRASALLFAIENRTACQVSQAQRATALYLTRKVIEERESEFLAAFAAGANLPHKPRIQDLERYAHSWVDLVSEVDASLKAALVFTLGEKYAFTAAQVPNLRLAIGLDQPQVEAAFQRQYQAPLSSIYRQSIPATEHLRWAASRLASILEGLPPFWVAFLLTIPLGSGILAMPIALADVGPWIGIALVILFGLISALTTACLAEAVARSSTTSLGLGYLGQLVAEYLGPAGSILLTATLAVDSFLCLIIFNIGIADTLEAASRLPGEAWILGLLALILYFLTRRSLNSTVASTLIVTSANLILLLIIPVFALPYLNPANFSSGGDILVGGGAFNFSLVKLIFGVLVSAYSSHLLVGNYGRVILRRDPGARSWIWGCLAAIGVAMLISILWVIAFNGALPPSLLANETGTAVTALASLAGPVVHALGSAFVVLSLGIGCIQLGFGLFFLVDERLPDQAAHPGSGRVRFILCILPVILAFLVSEALAALDRGSFTGLLGFVGVMTLPMIAGIFPILLLASTRRKGDLVPGIVLPGLGNPFVLGGIYVIFLVSIFLHGLFGFQGALEQAIILLVGGLLLVVSGLMIQQGALARRAVVEIRQDLTTHEPALFTLTAAGQPAISDVWLEYPDATTHLKAAKGAIPNFISLRSIKFSLPLHRADELKVWVYKINHTWIAEGLPAQGTVEFGNQQQALSLSPSSKQRLVQVGGEDCRLDIQLKSEG